MQQIYFDFKITEACISFLNESYTTMNNYSMYLEVYVFIIIIKSK